MYELGSESLCSTTKFWFWPLGYKLRQDLDCKKRYIEGRERERERLMGYVVASGDFYHVKMCHIYNDLALLAMTVSWRVCGVSVRPRLDKLFFLHKKKHKKENNFIEQIYVPMVR